MKPLPNSFYARNTITVARELLGKFLVRQEGTHKWTGRIVEVEAYIGEDDPACHAFHGFTPRTQIMYGPPGHAYVYFTYGMYFMLNVVTEKEGFPAAVLIRAVEPVSGFSSKDPKPASGPGKLCRSMEIDKTLNGVSLQSSELYLTKNPGKQPKMGIRWSSRIGITEGADKLWRAYLYGNPHVSRKSNPLDSLEPSPI
ncbi:DNA-3-methyladenine glycosylase [bacterium]|nr:DNA-3-methyladenine glycosylase [bacterium]MCI0605184.1 DNA-3-methyladenine glycosylase [bacterium]